MSTYVAGLSSTATDMATAGAVTARQPGGQYPPQGRAVPERPEYEHAPKGQPQGQQYPYGGAAADAHPANTRRQPGTAADQLRPARTASGRASRMVHWAQQQPGQQQEQLACRQLQPIPADRGMLPQKAKTAIRSLYGIIGVAAIVLGVALLIWRRTRRSASRPIVARHLLRGLRRDPHRQRHRHIGTAGRLAHPGHPHRHNAVGRRRAGCAERGPVRTGAGSIHHDDGWPRLDDGRRDGARRIMAYPALRLGGAVRDHLDYRRSRRTDLAGLVDAPCSW